MSARYRVKSDPLTRTELAVITGAAAAGFLIVGVPLGLLLHAAYRLETRWQNANREHTTGGIRGALDKAATR